MRWLLLVLLAVPLVGCSTIGLGVGLEPGDGVKVTMCIKTDSDAYLKIRDGLDKIKTGGFVDGVLSLAECEPEAE